MLKKLFALLTETEEREKYNEIEHKLCSECGGSGLDFIAGPCTDCNGNGFINKTQHEIWLEKARL